MWLGALLSLAVPAFGEVTLAANEAAHPARSRAARAAGAMDESGFREFYAQTGPRLRAYLLRACGDAVLAEDLLQESFYRFLRAKLPPAEPWQAKAYLFRIAHSLLVDHWRKVQRDRRWSLKVLIGSAEASRNKDASGDAMHIFRRLKPREQTLLWLAYVEGFDHREIAAALQLGEKSVRVLLFRARKSFAAALQGTSLRKLSESSSESKS